MMNEEFRGTVRQFLNESLPTGWTGLGALEPEDRSGFRENWREKLVASRLIAPTWPVEYGGLGLEQSATAVIAEEFARRGVPRGVATDIPSIQMIGNLILDLCSEDVKNRFLPAIVAGDIRFCQGFSEPDSGSDLGSVMTRASQDGDSWIINGQKIWTSNAMNANWIFVLCRSDSSAPKHKGLTLLLAPLDPAHVDIRPIKMINGEANFCEVFIDNLATDIGLEVGGPGGGWSAATRLLSYERGATSAVIPVRFKAELERLWELVTARGLDQDPFIRRDFARCWAHVEIIASRGQISVDAWSRGQDLGADTSFQKLDWSELHGRVTHLALRVLGPEVLAPTGTPPASYFMCDEPGSRSDSALAWTKIHLSTYGETLAAGTSEIQRNVIGERVLGLPRVKG